MDTLLARFAVGQLVSHTLFGYRGAIIDVDATFQGTEEWYSKMTADHPPKNEPWYHILVHGSVHHSYAAESQLAQDVSGEPIEHPELDFFFNGFHNGVYSLHQSTN